MRWLKDWTPQNGKQWVAQIALTLAFNFAARPIYKLAEDAMLGWINDQIASAFGIAAPTADAVFSFFWTWCLPFAAAAGVLWAYHKTQGHPAKGQKQNAASDKTADGLIRAGVRRIAEATADAPSTDTGRTYNAGLKLPIIDEAITILNHNAVFEQPIDDAGRFKSSLISELKAGHHGELLSKLADLRQRFVANNQRIGSLYVKVESIHEDIAAILVQPYSDALMTGIYELSDALKKLDNPAPANIELWLKPQIEKFEAGIAGVGKWRGTTLFALFDLRRKLVA